MKGLAYTERFDLRFQMIRRHGSFGWLLAERSFRRVSSEGYGAAKKASTALRADYIMNYQCHPRSSSNGYPRRL